MEIVTSLTVSCCFRNCAILSWCRSQFSGVEPLFLDYANLIELNKLDLPIWHCAHANPGADIWLRVFHIWIPTSWKWKENCKMHTQIAQENSRVDLLLLYRVWSMRRQFLPSFFSVVLSTEVGKHFSGHYSTPTLKV